MKSSCREFHLIPVPRWARPGRPGLTQHNGIPNSRLIIVHSIEKLLLYLPAEVGIFGKLARSRLAQLANASQLSDLFFSSLANTSQLGGLRLSLLAVGGAERAMRARHF